VTFDHTADPSGLQLVPDLALTLPAPSDGGRTYAFRLRQGIRYSDGTPLRASDFRRGIERLFVLGSPSAPSYANLVGAGQCARSQAARCDLARAIVTDNPARTIVFHLTGPDPEFLAKLAGGYAVPVPPGTPSTTSVHTRFPDRPLPDRPLHPDVDTLRAEPPLPRVVARRPAERIPGHDRLALRLLERRPDARRPARRRRLDVRADPAEASRPDPDPPRHTTSVNPVLGTEFLRMQTNRLPFDSLKARRALNYAIDRDAVVRLYGGRSLAAPTCQVLPPGLSGYVRYCPYAHDLARRGALSRPRAQRE
jgi:peptide/nickel transport system substrate-binding protein